MAAKLLTEPLLYLSLFFKRHREDYYRRLDAVRIEGDWEGWLDFFLDGVATIADEAVVTHGYGSGRRRRRGVLVRSFHDRLGEERKPREARARRGAHPEESRARQGLRSYIVCRKRQP